MRNTKKSNANSELTRYQNWTVFAPAGTDTTASEVWLSPMSALVKHHAPVWDSLFVRDHVPVTSTDRSASSKASKTSPRREETAKDPVPVGIAAPKSSRSPSITVPSLGIVTEALDEVDSVASESTPTRCPAGTPAAPVTGTLEQSTSPPENTACDASERSSRMRWWRSRKMNVPSGAT